MDHLPWLNSFRMSIQTKCGIKLWNYALHVWDTKYILASHITYLILLCSVVQPLRTATTTITQNSFLFYKSVARIDILSCCWRCCLTNELDTKLCSYSPRKTGQKKKRSGQLAQEQSHEYVLGVWSFSVAGRNLLPLGHTFLLARRPNDASDYRD